MTSILKLFILFSIIFCHLEAKEVSQNILTILQNGILTPQGTIAKNNNKNSFPNWPTPNKKDPINGTIYQNILVGPNLKVPWYDPLNRARFDFYRYITLYNSARTPEFLMTNFPSVQEECYDEGWRFAEWSQDVNFEITYTGTVGAEYLGLSASIQMSIKKGVNYRTSRSLRGTLGLEAIHLPYGSTEDWTGITYIQYYDSSSGDWGFQGKTLLNDTNLTSYPFPFYINNQNFIFKVKRTGVRICPGFEGKISIDPTLKEQLEFVP